MAAPTLLLLHGLGATNGVWAPVLEQIRWPGPVVMPDLPGHGRADWTGDYTIGAMAAAVGSVVDDTEVTVVGHSLGGGVGLCLASGFFRPNVVGVLGVGIKTDWSDDAHLQMAAVAAKGTRWHDTRNEAVERYLRQSGLAGLIEADHPAVTDAVTDGPGGWRVTQDPATFAQRPLDMAALVGAARCDVMLAAGGDDSMVSGEDLAVYSPDPRIGPDRGHNVHVEDPAWIIELIEELAAR